MIITLGVIAQTILLYLNCKLLIRNLRVTKSELALVLIILVISTATYFRIGAYSSLIIIPCVFGLNFFTQKNGLMH